MANFIALIDYTDRGIGNIADSPKRASAIKEMAGKLGATIKDLYWTMGAHDGVVIFEAADDAAAASLMLGIARLGNVKTHTMRAFDRSEMESVLAAMPD